MLFSTNSYIWRKTNFMEQYITNLIRTDVNRAMYAHLSREFLDIHTESLGTDHVISILHFMEIEQSDEVIDTYFDLVNTSRQMTDKEEVKALPKLIHDFLLTCKKRKTVMSGG